MMEDAQLLLAYTSKSQLLLKSSNLVTLLIPFFLYNLFKTAILKYGELLLFTATICIFAITHILRCFFFCFFASSFTNSIFFYIEIEDFEKMYNCLINSNSILLSYLFFITSQTREFESSCFLFFFFYFLGGFVLSITLLCLLDIVYKRNHV